MRVTLDIETYSDVDIKARGAFNYASGDATEVYCVCFKRSDYERVEVWLPPDISKRFLVSSEDVAFLRDAVTRADEIWAHNIEFESSIWASILNPRYGLPPLDPKKLKCSAALAASYALPRSLSGVCSSLNLSTQKDAEGHALMMKMCKPYRGARYGARDDLLRLIEYCKTDVLAEEAVIERLSDMPKSEWRVQRVDQIINRRGIPIDTEGVADLKQKVSIWEQKLLSEIPRLTKNAFASVRQVAELIKWAAKHGVILENLTASVVEEKLSGELPADVRRVLEIRQILSKSSVAKLDAMKSLVCADGRVRGAHMFHGASTGRWSGKGVQTQNMPRETRPEADIDAILKLDLNAIEMIYGDPILEASKCLRGMICAAPGKHLMAADYNSIEARVLAWIAGEKAILEAFRQGLDLYKVEAAAVFGVPYAKIDKDQRMIGKILTLSNGYKGWLGAFNAMAANYGVVIPEETAKELILKWRGKRRSIVAFWDGVFDAAVNAIKTNGVESYGRIKYGVRDGFLCCKLPSGRLLRYHRPRLVTRDSPFGPRQVIAFDGVDSTVKKWCEQYAHAGILTENICQAIARDVLAEALVRCENAGIDVIMHVHDEIVAEVITPDLPAFINVLVEVPAWATGLPLAADGWTGKRYRK